MQVFSKTMPPLKVEDVKGSLVLLERHMGYFQEQTDHVLAQLRKRLGIQGDDQQAAAQTFEERLAGLEAGLKALDKKLDGLETRVAALESAAQGG